jgi:hypothetical protein
MLQSRMKKYLEHADLRSMNADLTKHKESELTSRPSFSDRCYPRKSAAQISLLIVGLLIVPFQINAQATRDDQKLLDDTRSAYSILRRQGLIEVRASMIPRWQPVFRNLPVAQKPTAMRLANRLRFSILADSAGRIQVTHRIFGPKPDKVTANVLDNIAKGVELSATGFLMSWAPFMLTSLIPEKLDQFVMQEIDSKYVLSFRESGVDVSVAMTKDLLMTELKTAQGTVRPTLVRTSNGFVLTGYEAKNADPLVGQTELKARVVSQEINGMSLPKTVFLDGSSGQVPFHFELHFANYRLKKK